ncbi:phage holin family protein [Ruegeria arenilitoris]|uniref:phage holin family protein n=1 Tax=Ruegeria arenilitoris TaxID=1173585 RepID=UPI00147D6A57|nr:phage holin family protein [Ruegeria arenilitoris]
MSRISRNISIILRTERLIAQRNMTVLAKRAGFFAAAGLAGGLAIIMLNVAGYLALASVMSKPLAALVIALINLIVALILAAIANSVSAEADTAPVAELRDMAIGDIEAEVQDMMAEARETVRDLRTVSRDPLGTLAPGLVTMIASAVLKHLKNRKE